MKWLIITGENEQNKLYCRTTSDGQGFYVKIAIHMHYTHLNNTNPVKITSFMFELNLSFRFAGTIHCLAVKNNKL